MFSSVAQSCLTLCDHMDCSMPGFFVHHQLPELTQHMSMAYIFPFLPCLLLLFFSQLFVRPPQTILSFWVSFSWGWSRSLPPVTLSQTSVHSSSGTLSDLIPWIYFSLPLIIIWIWFRSYLNGLEVFPTFFNLSLNLAIRCSWSEPQSAPRLVFADCIELLHLQLQRI